MVTIDQLKLPPHHLDAEKGVLAGIFLDNELMYMYESIALSAADFYQKEHAFIFTAMTQLRDKRKTLDAVTVSNMLKKNDTLDDVWWIDYLYELSTFLLTTSSCPEYAQIIKEKSTLRSILWVCQNIIWDVYAEKDTIEILDSIEKRIFDLTQVDTATWIRHIKDVLNTRVEEYMEIVDNPAKADEQKTFAWYSNLDALLWWFKPWELIILAARPAMGKTAFALNLLMNAALEQKKTVAFFSLEMTSEQLVDRVLAWMAMVDMRKIARGDLNGDDFARIGDSIERLWESDIYLDDMWSTNIPSLKSKLRRLKIEKGNLDMVVIDYLQLMNAAWSKFAWNRVMEVSEMSRALKEMAKELELPIVVLSQLSRAVEQRVDKEPQLSDLRDSGAIEQDADSVMMMYREEYYDPDTDRKWATNIFVRKNRNWPIGDAELFFQKENMKFIELEW